MNKKLHKKERKNHYSTQFISITRNYKITQRSACKTWKLEDIAINRPDIFVHH